MNTQNWELENRKGKLEALDLKRRTIENQRDRIQIRIMRIELKRKKIKDQYTYLTYQQQMYHAMLADKSAAHRSGELAFQLRKVMRQKESLEAYLVQHSDLLLIELKAKEKSLTVLARELSAIYESQLAAIEQKEQELANNNPGTEPLAEEALEVKEIIRLFERTFLFADFPHYAEEKHTLPNYEQMQLNTQKQKAAS
ncbi:hypothetical protein V6R21_06485 [Limibacter armeniacum]|uniref:hypothetical protein n=1 Tax=Limibacter armeniacum TaxID=466084 RepID=UPI002FE5BB37